MRLLPATNFGRLVLLIGGVLFATLVLSLLVLREVSLNRGGEQIGDLLADQIVTARVLQQLPARFQRTAADGASVLDIRSQPAPPPSAEPPQMLFARQIEARLKYRLGSQTQMRIEESPESRVWINDGVGNRWVGIASPPFRRQAVLLTVTVASLASLIVLIAAAFYARVLSRPLERLAASAATIASGEFVANAESLHATREVQQLQAALEQAAASVRDAGSEREMLLAGVSHDIRTPLARLRYLHELHPSGDADADAAVLRNINDIDRLVGQFIDYARDGREEAKALLDPLQMLGQLCEEAAERGCVWEFEREACGDLRCHAMALTRAIRNLMRNAENHGAAPFRLSLDSRDTSLCITVSDSGAGVTEQDWSRLVRPFQRGGELTRPAGAGLGLAIACRVAAIHGGRILSRRHAGGFEVTLQLPRPAATTS